MEDFLSNKENKPTLIHLIANQLKKRKCDVIHAEGDADLDIVKTTISASSEKTTTLIGEDTDLLVLLLYYASLCNDKNSISAQTRGALRLSTM